MFQDLSTRQYSIGEIVRKSWIILRDNRKKFFNYLLYIFAIVLVIDVIGSFFANDMVIKIFGILSKLISLFGMIAAMLLAQKIINQENIASAELIKQTRQRYWEVFLTGLIAAIFLGLLFLLLIVPGIIFTFYWEFAVTIAVLTGTSSLKALRASKEIVKGRWWTICGYSLGTGVIVMIAGILLAIPAIILDYFWTPLGVLAGSAASSVMVVYSSILSVIFYLNFKGFRKPVPIASEIK